MEVVMSRTARLGLAGAVTAVAVVLMALAASTTTTSAYLAVTGTGLLMSAAAVLWAVANARRQSRAPDVSKSGRRGHVFVSYSRRDIGYVRRLVAFLRDLHIDVWMDEQIPNGTRWDQVLKDRIDTAAVVVLVMSPAAEESNWVNAEVDRARAHGKPLLPLLLKGNVTFGLSRIQHEDVTSGRMPRADFVRRLRDLTGAAQPPLSLPQPGDATRRLLPIPSATRMDVGQFLARLAENRHRRIDVLIGIDESGKSTLLRKLVVDYRDQGDDVRYLDLSLVDWRQALPTQPAASVVFIDHLDRIAEVERFRAAFDIFDRVLPALFSAGLSRLILALSTDWRTSFTEVYRLPPEVMLNKALPDVPFEAHFLRTYSDEELATLCGELGLDADGYRDVSLRRAGVLAMASNTSEQWPQATPSRIRDVLAARWIEAGNGSLDRDARRAMWELVGTLTLQGEPVVLDLEQLSHLLDDRFDRAHLRAQVGGPLRLEAEHVEPDSPAWADLAAARVLRSVLAVRTTTPIISPLRTSVLDTLRGLYDPGDLTAQVDRKLTSIAGADFTAMGYLGPVLATLRARLSPDELLVFRDLSLQGPDHSEVRTIGPQVAAAVEAALLHAMRRSLPGLVRMLNEVQASEHSAYRGGSRVWLTARAWASGLPLRASAESTLAELLPNDGSWRYEDILDIAVTGATTKLMSGNVAALHSCLSGRHDPVEQYLADVWDGVNDGAWDQIDATTRAYVASLDLPPAMTGSLTAIHCRLQRAHLGAQDVRAWRLIDCELLLADFRSCANVELADFSGSNWWAAILPPPARYHLSRSSADPRFLAWCAAPPWSNPYYTSQWPTPFD
ncbi:toll/interleukin-1 receptor domain-containing protein [Micromonospora robiginosa]|uniref:Toll/interleukin-1 receptor domain-containing protein n=1 Tax=Micromonospora robiginosa TaxID=2749844 RepID=A0A7L6B486_9ACTN|nr:toll/interleukin-1 receptor domain-containing protein [Micromonospora ferruginea]QLQ36714.1 toll/interleukin-1 receptor domain-containing protein [Micromonospora ferruginea]